MTASTQLVKQGSVLGTLNEHAIGGSLWRLAQESGALRAVHVIKSRDRGERDKPTEPMKHDQAFWTIKIPKPNRRWFRFGLSTMLLCVTIICIVLSRNYPRTHVVARINVSVLAPDDRLTHVAVARSPIVLTAALNDDEVYQLPILEQQEDPLAWLMQNLKVQTDNGVMEIRVSGKPPEHAQLVKISDAIVRSYLEFVGKTLPVQQTVTVMKD